MREARPVLPIDLLALVSGSSGGHVNQAWTRNRIGNSGTGRSLAMAADQCLAFAKGRGAWISADRQRLYGLVGARRRGGPQAWEIDYLLDAEPSSRAVLGLLECATRDAGRKGAEKLFLRLDAGSGLARIAVEAGFAAYQEETLYLRRRPLEAQRESPPMRAVTPADSYLLYRLYNAATPEATRRREAATFSEWHAAQERRWLRNGLQLLHESDGAVDAWLRAARLHDAAVVDLLATGPALDQAESMIASAIHSLDAAGAPVYVLATRAQGLAARLEQAGFEAVQEFACYSRRTTRPLPMPKAIPAVANTPVGV